MKRRKWTREECIEAAKLWASRHKGQSPRTMDWDLASEDYPARAVVKARFPSWNAMLEAAGLPIRAPHGGWPARKRKLAENMVSAQFPGARQTHDV